MPCLAQLCPAHKAVKLLLARSWQYQAKYAWVGQQPYTKRRPELTQLAKGISGQEALLRKQPKSKRSSPSSTQPLSELGISGGEGLHPLRSPGEHRCKPSPLLPRQPQPFPRCSITVQVVTSQLLTPLTSTI